MYNGVNITGSGLIENVQTKWNYDCGICAVTRNGSAVRACTATQNGNNGIFMNIGVAEGNVTSWNQYDGLLIEFGTAVGNSAFRNGLAGIEVFNSNYSNNSAYGNSAFQIYDDGGSTSIKNNNCNGSAC